MLRAATGIIQLAFVLRTDRDLASAEEMMVIVGILLSMVEPLSQLPRLLMPGLMMYGVLESAQVMMVM